MGKKWIIIAILISGILLAILCGIYVYNKQNTSDSNMTSDKKLADMQASQENTAESNWTNESITTSSINMNISPNAIIIQKKYYKSCDHLIREIIDIPEELVNKTESDVKAKYPDWKIEGYSPTEIVLYKQFDGYCDQHYIIKENDGVIGIYTVDEAGVETLKENTEISTMYLPKEDLDNLKVGIKIVGQSNLYDFLEDYE